MRAKKPASRQDCRAFFAHRSSRTTGSKLPGGPKAAIFDAEQGSFPQAPFAPARETGRSCAQKLPFRGGGFLRQRAFKRASCTRAKKGGHIAGGPLVRGSELASPAQRPGRRLACFQRAAAGRALGPVPEAEAVYAPRQSEGACRESITTKANSLSGRKGSFYLQQAEGPRRIRTPAPRRHRRHTRWRCRPSAP